jgi:sodium-coupled neutral amino acid transporter 11
MPPNHTKQGDSIDSTGTAEAQGLLLPDRDNGQDANGHTGFDTPEARRQFPRRSSILRPEASNGGPKTPRTANRVRFDIEEEERKSQEAAARANGNGGGLKHPHSNGRPTAPPSPRIRSPGVREWLEEEDYLSDGSAGSESRRGSTSSQRLLTDIEAPGVTLAMEGDDDSYEVAGVEVHGRGRPKSNVLSAFMNMANSIIGAGIIGQPYALRQAGLLTGVVLLVLLTVTVDWTIRLIVVNSKLSGANSFQATMEHCFGRKGLIAISVAQWAFAFGGMVAFCVIVGDSIPRVLSAVWPNAGWVADRRLVIVVCVLSVGWPLSLYRDIAKLAKASTLALISMAIIIVAVITQGVRVPAESKGGFKGSLVIQPGIFQAIGVISFGKLSVWLWVNW